MAMLWNLRLGGVLSAIDSFRDDGDELGMDDHALEAMNKKDERLLMMWQHHFGEQ